MGGPTGRFEWVLYDEVCARLESLRSWGESSWVGIVAPELVAHYATPFVALSDPDGGLCLLIAPAAGSLPIGSGPALTGAAR